MKWLRYLGKQQRILALYEALRQADGPRHPTQLSRETGMDMFEVRTRLEACPELFVKLPRRPDGVVRYRLTSSAAALDEDRVRRLIASRARVEQLQVTAGVVILLCLALIVLLTVIPATAIGL